MREDECTRGYVIICREKNLSVIKPLQCREPRSLFPSRSNIYCSLHHITSRMLARETPPDSRLSIGAPRTKLIDYTLYFSKTATYCMHRMHPSSYLGAPRPPRPLVPARLHALPLLHSPILLFTYINSEPTPARGGGYRSKEEVKGGQCVGN